MSDKKEPNKNEPKKEPVQRRLIEDQDYYIENGNYVFTAFYLKSRGYCCSNGCRHCPWEDQA